MYTANYVKTEIEERKRAGLPLQSIAWDVAKMCVGWPYVFGARGEYCDPSNRRARARDDHPTVRSNCRNFDGNDNIPGKCVGCKWFLAGADADQEQHEGRVRFFDCRGFTYWILLQVYGWKLIGEGATSQWNTESNWKAKGEVRDGIPQGVIVCLFYYKKDSSGKRTKTLEHTGLYYNGETIECSSGVQYTKGMNKKWEVWGIPACVDEKAPDPQPTPTDKKPTLRQGDRGTYVTMMQEELQDIGYNIGSAGADGIFGKNTRSAVVAFQTNKGLKADGICGTATWTALDAAQQGPKPKPEPAEDRYTVTIPGVSLQQAEELCKEWSGASMKKE